MAVPVKVFKVVYHLKHEETKSQGEPERVGFSLTYFAGCHKDKMWRTMYTALSFLELINLFKTFIYLKLSYANNYKRKYFKQ